MSKGLSIIIPAYNAESFILRCLCSIYSLSLMEEDFEVIVIDDCSTDNTLQLVKDYAMSHSNMRVLTQLQNHRQGAARNIGLKSATGKYIMFVDADDIVESGLIDALILALNLHPQVLLCNYDVQRKENEIEHRILNCQEKVSYNGSDFLEEIYDTYFCTCPINYLWDRCFLLSTNILFVEERRMEDIDWIEKTLFRAHSIMYYRRVIYKVIGHEQSTTRTIDVGTVADWLHFSYRRLFFAEQFKQKLPQYYNKVLEDTSRIVINKTRIRLLTRFSCNEIRQIYGRAEKESLLFLKKKYTWPLSTQVFLSFPILTQGLSLIVYPIAENSRKIFRIIRNNHV